MPKIVDHAKQRESLLTGCFGIFARKGYSNVTMRELASELGVSTGTLYHYFPTKLEILKQLFVWAVDTDLADYGRRTDSGLSQANRLEALATFWSDKEEHYRNLFLLALDLFRHAPEEAEETLGHFATRYKEGTADSLNTHYRVGHVVYTYMLGVVAHTLLAPSQIDYCEEVGLIRSVLRIVLPNPNGASLSLPLAAELADAVTSAGADREEAG